jgi:nitrate reductase assembly molybdenum cofactor insertion protein NarJ
VTPEAESLLIEVLRRMARADLQLTPEERLELFDANTRWLNELQTEQLSEAKARGTRITRKNRGWTREDLYEDVRGPS